MSTQYVTSNTIEGVSYPLRDSDAVHVDELKALILDYTYPVGSIYISANSTSPATLFGGTWSMIKDKFILLAGDTYRAGSTGGEASHKLTIDEMPRHNHTQNPHNHTQDAHNHSQNPHSHSGGDWTFSVYKGTRSIETVGEISGSGWKIPQVNSGGSWGGYPSIPDTAASNVAATASNNPSTATNNPTGNDGYHNNMPPYEVFYGWVRTA